VFFTAKNDWQNVMLHPLCVLEESFSPVWRQFNVSLPWLSVSAVLQGYNPGYSTPTVMQVQACNEDAGQSMGSLAEQ
jgi:hypothetical protein